MIGCKIKEIDIKILAIGIVGQVNFTLIYMCKPTHSNQKLSKTQNNQINPVWIPFACREPNFPESIGPGCHFPFHTHPVEGEDPGFAFWADRPSAWGKVFFYLVLAGCYSVDWVVSFLSFHIPFHTPIGQYAFVRLIH
jgi:hypothetical protein